MLDPRELRVQLKPVELVGNMVTEMLRLFIVLTSAVGHTSYHLYLCIFPLLSVIILVVTFKL